MSWFSSIRGAWDRIWDYVPPEVFVSGADLEYTPRDPKPEIAERTEAIYTCSKIISEAIGSLPFHVYRGEGAARERVEDHWLTNLFNDPGLNMTRQELIEKALWGCCVCGWGPVQKVANGMGDVLQLVPLDPKMVECEIIEDGGKAIKVYKVGKEVVDPRELWLPSNVWGLSPVSVLARQIDLSRGYERHGVNVLANGAKPSGILTHPERLTKEAKDQLREAWRRKYQGTKNAGNVLILTEGMTFTPTTIPNEDLQFIEQAKFTRNVIIAAYRIPQHMAGNLENATFSNIEHQSIEFVKYTLLPWITRLEQSIKRDFLMDEDTYVRFNVDGLLRGDYKTRMEGNAIAINSGQLSPNEARKLEDRDPKENGDRLIIPMNMRFLDEEMNEEMNEDMEEVNDGDEEDEREGSPVPADGAEGEQGEPND